VRRGGVREGIFDPLRVEPERSDEILVHLVLLLLQPRVLLLLGLQSSVDAVPVFLFVFDDQLGLGVKKNLEFFDLLVEDIDRLGHFPVIDPQCRVFVLRQ
jgi:hypothetical protein